MGNLVQLENFSKILPYATMIKEGLAVTVLLSLFTVAIGFVLATLLAVMRMCNFTPFLWLSRAFPKTFGFFEFEQDGSKRDAGFLYHMGRFNPLSFIATTYVEVIRSTPVLVQILIIYYGIFGPGMIELPTFTMFGFIKFHRFFPGVIALGMNSGAYLCEIIRSGMQSIDGGQTEAARSLGLNSIQNLRYIIMPQAIRNILPAIANEFVVIIKESAVTFTIGVSDVYAVIKSVQSATFIVMEPLLVVTAIYFCLCFPTSKIIAYFERRMSRGSKR